MKAYMSEKVYKSLTQKQRSAYGDMINRPGAPVVKPRTKNPWRNIASIGDEDSIMPAPDMYAGAPMGDYLPSDPRVTNVTTDVVTQPNGWQIVGGNGSLEPWQPSIFDQVGAAYKRGNLWTK